jgi:putative flippase GtrA
MIFARYIGIGGLATLIHYLTTIFVVELDLATPGWAASGGAIVGALVAYGLNRAVTFGGTTRPLIQGLWRFGAVAFAGALANGLIVALGTSMGMYYLLAQAFATTLILPATFTINKRWTFQ